MRVLITGVAGFMGSHLADSFLDKGNVSGGIAQLVEQRDHNPQVGGSNPSPATSFVLAISELIVRTKLASA